MKEPNVFIDVGKINFGPLLLGGKNKETVRLKNIESVPIQFSFSKDSIKGDIDYADSLSITPMNGVVRPDSEVLLEVTFQPKVERSFNYNLICDVKRKSRPVTLNVKGIGYILHHEVSLDGKQSSRLSSTEQHVLEFGNIFVNEKKVRRITIQNQGDFNFDFLIKKPDLLINQCVMIDHEHGTVRKQESFSVELTFAPIAEYKFKQKQSRITLQIVSGPAYHFNLSGSARTPSINFSFTTYDFGPCFVLK